MAQPSMKVLGPKEMAPANGTNDPAALETALRGSIQPSNAHQCCTTPMMKLEYGGVLANDLTVYGTSNLSVVGVSTFPLTVGSAPSSTLYAAAEKVSLIFQLPLSVILLTCWLSRRPTLLRSVTEHSEKK